MIGNLGDMLNSLAKPPSRSKGSQTPTPAASTRTRISFASNSGTGSSRIFISFKPPNRSIATVFIVFVMVLFIEHLPHHASSSRAASSRSQSSGRVTYSEGLIYAADLGQAPFLLVRPLASEIHLKWSLGTVPTDTLR